MLHGWRAAAEGAALRRALGVERDERQRIGRERLVAVREAAAVRAELRGAQLQVDQLHAAAARAAHSLATAYK